MDAPRQIPRYRPSAASLPRLADRGSNGGSEALRSSPVLGNPRRSPVPRFGGPWLGERHDNAHAGSVRRGHPLTDSIGSAQDHALAGVAPAFPKGMDEPRSPDRPRPRVPGGCRREGLRPRMAPRGDRSILRRAWARVRWRDGVSDASTAWRVGADPRDDRHRRSRNPPPSLRGSSEGPDEGSVEEGRAEPSFRDHPLHDLDRLVAR